MQVVAITWSWIDEGGTFWPLIAMDRGFGAVGATKSVEEMMAGEGSVTGCGEGLKRNRPAIMITRRMMPPMVSGDEIVLTCTNLLYPVSFCGCCIHAGSGVPDGQTEPVMGLFCCCGDKVSL
jgi:hypothetical protein